MIRKRYLLSAFCFSILLNFKHIYLYCSPAFFMYLLVHYVLRDQAGKAKENSVMKFMKLAIITIIPFVVSFGPFFVVDGFEGIKQIFSRLFPFGRGLVHEFWAPNFWALYMFFDKIVYFAMTRIFKSSQLQLIPKEEIGVNPNTHLKVLPNIPPVLTIAIILAFLLPFFYRVFKESSQSSKNQPGEKVTEYRQFCHNNFALMVCISGLIFFLFGFHVHEKAITPYINLLLLFCPQTKFVALAIFVNLVNLLPLLITPK